MLEAEPMIFWKLKINGVWKFQKARVARLPHLAPNIYAIEPPRVMEADESE
jgi:hypothetical protein